MSEDEKHWINEAIAVCEKATRAKLTIVLARFQDSDNQADIVLTNADTPEMLRAAAKVIDFGKPLNLPEDANDAS